MKVVIDANVFVSAAIQRGASHRIVMSWLAGTSEFELVMCPELLAEVREVLTERSRLRSAQPYATTATTTSLPSQEATVSISSSRAISTFWNGRHKIRPCSHHLSSNVEGAPKVHRTDAYGTGLGGLRRTATGTGWTARTQMDVLTLGYRA